MLVKQSGGSQAHHTQKATTVAYGCLLLTVLLTAMPTLDFVDRELKLYWCFSGVQKIVDALALFAWCTNIGILVLVRLLLEGPVHLLVVQALRNVHYSGYK